MPVFGGPDGQAGPRNARDRRPVACMPCRHRKLRCDRDVPACGKCVNRGDITACYYFSRKPEPHPKQPRTKPSSLAVSDSGQARIDHLEQLVLTLLKETRLKQNQIHTPSTSVDADHDESLEDANADHDRCVDACRPSETLTSTLGVRSETVINPNADYKERLSVDGARWGMLLNEIGEVRSHLHVQRKQYEEQTQIISQVFRRTSDGPGPTLLFGSAKNLSRLEILSQLPSRYSCDVMITRYFAHLYPALHILHQRSFLRQYERFWNDESTTSTAWVAILFGTLRIAMLDYVREGDEPQEFRGKCRDLANTFRNRLTDCLILADYTRPQDFLIEALGFHIYGEYVLSRDAKSSVWVLGGMVARLAIRMGYHQRSQPGLTSTPFQASREQCAEMRRRSWAYIRQLDIMISFQLGLPSMIGLPLLEGPFPRNIYDNEAFDEDCTSLPPSLPDSEPTQVSYLLAKSKLVFAFARVLDEITRSEAMRWERVLELDRELRYLYQNVPEYYKLGPLSSHSSLVLVSARFVLSSIHHKSLCILHSRFLETSNTDDRFSYSRRVCLNSAMSILRFQAIQNQDIPVDGRLRSLTPYQTSITIHDYLLAATIITADLRSGRSAQSTAGQRAAPGVYTRTEMIKALSLSARIHASMRDQSVEAYKAADILDMLVRKFENEAPGVVQSPRNSTPSVPKDLTVGACVSPLSVQQTSPRDISVSSEAPSWLGLNNATTSSSIRSRSSQNPQLAPSRVSPTSHLNDAALERAELPDPEPLDDLSSWFNHQQMFATYEPSADWMMPDISAPVMEDSSGGPISMAANPTATYSTAMALHDPMSTLWNFSL